MNKFCNTTNTRKAHHFLVCQTINFEEQTTLNRAAVKVYYHKIGRPPSSRRDSSVGKVPQSQSGDCRFPRSKLFLFTRSGQLFFVHPDFELKVITI